MVSRQKIAPAPWTRREAQLPVGDAFEAVTPCDAHSAPATCSDTPPFPPNSLGLLDMSTGHIPHVSLRGANLQPKGMIFIAA
jgi:hypothetical protein